MKKNINTINNNPNNNQKHKKKIQIIGGKFKGKQIITIQHPDLRPTTNQIRETLFNWLMPIIHGANCLDCFAGSGALGLEALSRNANIVTFLEKNKKISNQLKKTIKSLKIKKQTKIITTDTNEWLISFNKNKHPHHYDIIFLDPPFSKLHYMNNTIKLLEKFQLTNKNTWIYIEKENTKNSLIIIPNTWKLHKKKHRQCFLPNLHQINNQQL